jgi:hypothetical protein
MRKSWSNGWQCRNCRHSSLVRSSFRLTRLDGVAFCKQPKCEEARIEHEETVRAAILEKA